MTNMYIPEMSVTNAINELATIYIPLINGNLSYASIPSPFLWGPPGIGKSDGINELGYIDKEHANNTRVEIKPVHDEYQKIKTIMDIIKAIQKGR